MKKPYTHQIQEERQQIQAYKKAEFSNLFIANELERHMSTIKRRLAETGGCGYRAD